MFKFQVCNAFSDRLGDKPIPPLAALPFGKNNAIASSIYDGSNDLLEACLHILHGKYSYFTILLKILNDDIQTLLLYKKNKANQWRFDL